MLVSCVFWDIHRVSEEIRILIGLIESIGGVMMGGVPGEACGLHVTGFKTDIVFGIARRLRACSRCCSSAGGHAAWFAEIAQSRSGGFFQMRVSHWPMNPLQSWMFRLTALSPTRNSAGWSPSDDAARM